MATVEYVPRSIEEELRRQLQRGKSVPLLGPRQTLAPQDDPPATARIGREPLDEARLSDARFA
jgi:hypothetical protein